MRKLIMLGSCLLLTLGSAVAGTFFYAQAPVPANSNITLPSDHEPQVQQINSVTIAIWKASAASTDVISPKAPI